MRKLLGLAGMLLYLSVAGSTAWGNTLLVPDQYSTIQAAVDAAVSGDEILIAPGIYSDPTHFAHLPDDSTLCCVVMKSGLTLRGAGTGQTIIDALHLGRGIHVQAAADVEICHMTIRGAFAEVYGAAIFCKGSSPYIHHMEIAGNFDGGIIAAFDSHPTIENCVMDNNEAKAGGGLAAELGCAPQVYDCRITNNRAPFAAGVWLRGDALLDHCIIDRNSTTGESGVLGGGILIVDGAHARITNCEVTNDSCGGNGGGVSIIGDGTQGTLEGCLIAGNVSRGDEGKGGGISVESDAIGVIRDCIVANNETRGMWSEAGGIYAQYAGLEIEGCTIYANSVGGSLGIVGNVFIETSMVTPHPVTITHAIISHSPNGLGVWCAGSGAPPEIGCCDVFGNAGGDDLCGTGDDNFSLDPLLCDPDAGNFHVEDASPCAPGNHPNGPGACAGALIGAVSAGCNSGLADAQLGAGTFALRSRPSPFTAGAVIAFTLPRSQEVSLEVIDPAGRSLALLYQGVLGAGEHQESWDGRGPGGSPLGSGVYFCRLRAGGITTALRLLRLQ